MSDGVAELSDELQNSQLHAQGDALGADAGTQASPSTHILDLPDELLEQVAAHLDHRAVLRLALVNRQFRSLARRNTWFNYDGTANRSGRFLLLLEEDAQLGPLVRRSEFEALDFLRPFEPPQKSVFHLMRSIITICVNLQVFVIHRLPAFDDVATHGTLIKGLSELTQLRRLELGTFRAPTTLVRETVDVKALNPALPADLLLWTLQTLTSLRHLSAIVGRSRSAALLPKMKAAPALTSLRTVAFTLRDPISDADLEALAARTFSSARSLTLTLEDTPSITATGMARAFSFASEALRDLVVTETSDDGRARGAYLDEALERGRLSGLRTMAVDLSSISAAAVRHLPPFLMTLVLDVTHVDQSATSSPQTSVYNALLEQLISNEAFLSKLKSFFVIGAGGQAALRIRMACAKRDAIPQIVSM